MSKVRTLSLKSIIESDENTETVVSTVLNDLRNDKEGYGEIVFFTPRDLYDMQFQQQGSDRFRPGVHHATKFMDMEMDNLLVTNYGNDFPTKKLVQQIAARGQNIKNSEASSEYWYGHYVVKGVRFVILVSGEDYSIVTSLADFEMLPHLFSEFNFRIGKAEEIPSEEVPKNESNRVRESRDGISLRTSLTVRYECVISGGVVKRVKTSVLPESFRSFDAFTPNGRGGMGISKPDQFLKVVKVSDNEARQAAEYVANTEMTRGASISALSRFKKSSAVVLQFDVNFRFETSVEDTSIRGNFGVFFSKDGKVNHISHVVVTGRGGQLLSDSEYEQFQIRRLEQVLQMDNSPKITAPIIVAKSGLKNFLRKEFYS